MGWGGGLWRGNCFHLQQTHPRCLSVLLQYRAVVSVQRVTRFTPLKKDNSATTHNNGGRGGLDGSAVMGLWLIDSPHTDHVLTQTLGQRR